MRKTKSQSADRLVLYDTLTKEKKEKQFSVWSGSKGKYVFRHLSQTDGHKKPLAQVYLNRSYLSGVFLTDNHLEFSGDIKLGKRKQYILFRLEGNAKMAVYLRRSHSGKNN